MQGAKPGGRKEVERERRKSLALDRRKTAAINQGSTSGAVKNFGHSSTLTPRTLVKRSHHKEHVLNILAEKNLRIGAFGKVETQEDQPAWKARPNAQQSPQVLNLKKRMEQRKRHMTQYTKNNTFVDIFKDTEDRRTPPATAGIVVAGTIELVARQVIEKHAEIQHREKKGVWAQLGKPYACFGLPASAIPKDCPMPAGAPPGEMYPFFGHAQKPQLLEVGQDVTKFRRKRAQPVTRESLNMQGMLIKLGLQGRTTDTTHLCHPFACDLILQILFLSDLHVLYRLMDGVCFHQRVLIFSVGSTKFPRAPLVEANDLKTAVKYGGACYTLGRSVPSSKRSNFDGRSRLSFDLTELFESWRSISGGSQSVLDMDFSNVPPPRMPGVSLPQLAKSPAPQLERPSTSAGEQSSHSLLYGWKKGFADTRKRLQDKLTQRLMNRTVRRRHFRSCSPSTAEISIKLLEHLEERGGGSKTPLQTGHIWKGVEDKQREMDASAVDPEVEAISKFYERVCMFVNNQKMDDPLMDMLVSHLKELLEEGYKLQKNLLIALCERLSKLQDHVEATGRMTCLMPILNFICKELHLTSVEFNSILGRFGLDWYNTFTRPSLSVTPAP
ncbi:uncharacterized protein LOC9643609 isoform X1 [Selaginella moellendorffii]|uniref:uncharacterized protein LOC9643609 isoform X1 n=1 Tax=Selaginella moellendorffii TaxID=88036 RepID=UPI000D1CAEC1|nr:uncharacterized protein LOC9643609 isoform X1 [Selaginella moellendorffii]|eukprot:XP_024524100.1 uncharacterized protein LOC9643609 isoform X1 [Selaginella moellendorffii]